MKSPIMNVTILLIATILMWIAVFVGLYQRIFVMPKWFLNPPSSFELIRRQSKKARIFWIPLSAAFMVSACIALVLNWQFADTRNHIIGALICFGITGLSGLYFVKEILSFTKIPKDSAPAPELLKRVKSGFYEGQ